VSPDDLCALAAETGQRLGVAGAQVAVLDGGEVREGTYGTENVLTGTPVRPETLFQVGSTTKVLTAALVMQLVEQGVVGLDTPVCEQLPGFQLSDARATVTVTPRHLMSMSSGIDNGPYSDYGPGEDALAAYVTELRHVPQVFAPGTGFGYSNASTTVSGRLVEHVTGQTWDVALHERLLEPAGLRSTFTSPTDVLTRRHALGHTPGPQPEVVRPWSLSRCLGPAGSTLNATAGDLVRFAALFLRRGVSLEGGRVLSAGSVEAMQAEQVTVPPTSVAQWWGLGPYGNRWGGHRVLGHSGTNLSGSSYLLWAPEQGIAVATLVNVASLGYPFARAVMSAVLEEHGITVPSAPRRVADVPYDAGRLVGSYAMSGQECRVSADDQGLWLTLRTPEGETEPSRLVPLTPTTFLPTDPRVDGGRGWALAFLGRDARPAEHLLNGLFALRRVSR
jgi:CubicO group peptidase (beta-lactamase class C family)